MNITTVLQNPERLSVINEALLKVVQEIVAGNINDVTARCNLKDAVIAAGYHPETTHIEPDSPEDLLSDARINLVILTNVGFVRGQRNWNANQNPVILTTFPADELFRIAPRKIQHDWLKRWRMAGEQTGDSIGTGWIITPDKRMIALKNHSIWNWIGSSKLFPDALDAAWPPFAFNSGMWTRGVKRSEAQVLGLIQTGQNVKPMRLTRARPPFLPIESERFTEYLWNEPTPCDHCGEEKPFKLLDVCDACGEFICPDCTAKGCTRPEPLPPPRSAMQCFSIAVEKMMGEKLPFGKDVAEQVLQWCDRAFEFGFAAHLYYFEARTHRMRGEAFESLGQKERALREYELAVEKDPHAGVKRRIVSLRKEILDEQIAKRLA